MVVTQNYRLKPQGLISLGIIPKIFRIYGVKFFTFFAVEK